MFTRLDDILFPNKVEVINFAEINKFVYPIYKCGSTSLRAIADDKGFKTLINQQIKNVDSIDTFIREPIGRYKSAVESYFYWLLQEFPEADINTVAFYLQQGLQLDRHLASQYQWLLNLGRYITDKTLIHLHSMDTFNEYARNVNVIGPKVKVEESLLESIVGSPHLQFCFRLDRIILDDLVGRQLTLPQITSHLMNKDPDAYSGVVEKAQRIAEVSRVLPSV